MTRFKLRYRAPDRTEPGFDEYHLGETRPPFLVVLKGVPHHGERAIAEAVSIAHGKRLNGSPIVILPPGAEFELWEVTEPEGEGRDG